MSKTKTIKRLVTLSEHQAFLNDVLATAKKRVVIVSPFISSKAIKDDNLSVLVKQAVARGVQVLVVVDYKLNTINGEMKLSAKEGIAELVNAGAKVAIANEIHNKTLARDNDLIAEGSFNWLSAVRVKHAENQREERTLVVTGEGVAQMIVQDLERVNKVEYAYATPAVSRTRFPKSVKALVVAAVVLACVLFFSPSNVKWLTFWAFCVGLVPFVIAAIRRDVIHSKSPVNYYKTVEDTLFPPIDETFGVVDHNKKFGYVPGVRDFDGTYFQ